MIARAPGKVVLSGAYAVLEGAPALVAAVDRYVVADAGREAARVVPEVAEALRRRGAAAPRAERAPWFDARALRDERRDEKLGLGSSAAILVASLAALELAADPALADEALAERVFAPALAAHRAAQRGGSGVDVAASAFGGILRYCREPVAVAPSTLPAPLFFQVWASARPASTADMLARVADAKAARPRAHGEAIARLALAAEAAASAQSAAAYLDACRAQFEGLALLGTLAGAPIVTRETWALAAALSSDSSVVLPAGAGGGDIALSVSTARPSEKAPREIAGFSLLPISLGAKGVHRQAPAPHSVHDRALP